MGGVARRRRRRRLLFRRRRKKIGAFYVYLRPFCTSLHTLPDTRPCRVKSTSAPGFVRGMRGPRQNHALKNRLYQALLQLLSCAAKCIHTRHSELPVAIEQKNQPGQSAKAARGAGSGNGGASATHPHDADSDQDAVGAPAGEQHARGSNPSRTHELQT